MTLLHIYNGSGLPADSVQLRSENGISAHAQLGEADQILIRVEDPTGSLDFVGFKSWRIIDDVFPPTTNTLWYGYVGRQRVLRDPSLGITTGSARVWDLELVEGNGWLIRRIYLPNDTTANRPSETIDARMSWFLSSRACSGLIYDRGDVASSLVVVDPTDYRGRTGRDVLNDMSLPTGYNFFLRWDDATGTLALHFHDPLLYQDDASTFQLSNVLTDLASPPANPWPPSQGATLGRDPNRIASGAYVAYTGGSVYDSSSTTQTLFGQVDQVSPSANVKTASTARLVASHFLDQHDEQDIRVTDVHVWLPPTNVRDFLTGQRIQGRFSHFPNYSNTGTYWRVPWKSINRFEQEGEVVYDVAMELTPATLITPQDTRARLMGEDGGSPNGPTEYQVVWNQTGDAPIGGQPYDPKYGLVAYQGSGPYTGLTMSGGGTLTVEMVASVIGVESGSQTLTFQVRKNGVVVLQETQTSTGGLRVLLFECDILGTIDVVAGDVISSYLLAPNATSTLTIPAGVGGPDHRLLIYGSLT